MEDLTPREIDELIKRRRYVETYLGNLPGIMRGRIYDMHPEVIQGYVYWMHYSKRLVKVLTVTDSELEVRIVHSTDTHWIPTIGFLSKIATGWVYKR